MVVHAGGDVSDGVEDVLDETLEAVHLFVASFETRVKNPTRQIFFLCLDFRLRFRAQMMRHNLQSKYSNFFMEDKHR